MTFWVAGAAVVGAGVSAYSSNQGSKKQAKGAAEANRIQQGQYDQTRADQLPWMQRGNAAGNRLQQLLGLSGAGGAGSGSMGTLTKNDLIDTSGGDWRANADLYQNDANYRAAWDKFDANHKQRFGKAANFKYGSGLQAAQDAILGGGFDLNGYNATTGKAAQQSIQGDPEYGSLMRDFGQQDLDGDVVYQTGLQFGLDEGRKGLERMALAGGGMQSGATLKALARFGNDYASTKAGESYNRFNNNKSQKYNMLAGIAGTGQTAQGQVQQAGMNFANNTSNNAIGMGNARAASSIAQGNAWSNAGSQIANGYQQNQLLQMWRDQNQRGGYNDEMARLNADARR